MLGNYVFWDGVIIVDVGIEVCISYVNYMVVGYNIDFNIGIVIYKSGYDWCK